MYWENVLGERIGRTYWESVLGEFISFILPQDPRLGFMFHFATKSQYQSLFNLLILMHPATDPNASECLSHM
jgi:hypothetical protein